MIIILIVSTQLLCVLRAEEPVVLVAVAEETTTPQPASSSIEQSAEQSSSDGSQSTNTSCSDDGMGSNGDCSNYTTSSKEETGGETKITKSSNQWCYESTDQEGATKLNLTWLKTGQPPPYMRMIYKIENNNGGNSYTHLRDNSDSVISFERKTNKCESTFRVTGQGQKKLSFAILTGNSDVVITRGFAKFGNDAADGFYDIIDQNGFLNISVKLERGGSAMPSHSREFNYGQVTTSVTDTGTDITVCVTEGLHLYGLTFTFDYRTRSEFQKLQEIEFDCSRTTDTDIKLAAWECSFPTLPSELTLVHTCEANELWVKIFNTEEDSRNKNFHAKPITETQTTPNNEINIYNLKLESWTNYKPKKQTNDPNHLFCANKMFNDGTCTASGSNPASRMKIKESYETKSPYWEYTYLWETVSVNNPNDHTTQYKINFFSDTQGCRFKGR